MKTELNESRTCNRAECGKKFVPFTRKNKYCSTECRIIDRNRINNIAAKQARAEEKKPKDLSKYELLINGFLLAPQGKNLPGYLRNQAGNI